MFAPWKESDDKPRRHIKKQTRPFADKDPSSQYGFSSSHIQMWELDHKEGWVPKNWCFWTVVLEETLKSPLDSKEIKPINPKGNQPWIFIGRTVPEALIHWSPDAKSWLTAKDSGTGKNWEEVEKGVAEFDMVRQHHQLNWHESGQTPWDSGEQRSLVCYSPWGHKESDIA